MRTASSLRLFFSRARSQPNAFVCGGMGACGEACFLCGVATPPLLRACHCDTRVHTACFLRLLRVPAHAERCPVCQYTYRLRRRNVVVLHPRRAAAWCGALSAWLFVAMTCAVVLCIDPLTRLAYAVSLFLLLSAAGCALVYALRSREHLCCVGVAPRVVGVEEATPRPSPA